MAVERSCVYRATIYVCILCVFLSCLFYFTIQPLPSTTDSYGTKMPIPAKPLDSYESVSKGLYAKSRLIDELNELTYKVVKDGKAPSLILYYASWCGHCRSFVPTYESVANTTLSKIAVLNNEHRKTSSGRRGYVNKPYTNLHFTAIDCATYSSICSKESITSYPTLIMQNVNRSSEKISGPSLKSATKFINEKYFSVQDQELKLTTGSEAGPAISSYVPKTQKMSYLATAEERFEDGLMSLDYMLLREIPREWSAVRTLVYLNHTSSLLSFLHILTHMFPTGLPHGVATVTVYQKLIGLIEDDLSSPGKFLSDKIINHISKLRPNSPKWRVCGRVVPPVSISPTTLSTNKTGNLRSGSTNTHSSLHPVGRHSRMLKKTPLSSSSSSSDTIVSYGADGYPCGLWFLFHYLSVASADPRYGFQYSAEEVLRSIYNLVKHFFACYDCREHFMRAYDDCTFDRCTIGEKNYDTMQLWLFHQHNAVTQRVWTEETDSGNIINTLITGSLSTGTSSTTAKDAVSNIDAGTTGSRANGHNSVILTENPSAALRSELWPSVTECSTCLDTPSVNNVSPSGDKPANVPFITNNTAILEYLHRAYAL